MDLPSIVCHYSHTVSFYLLFCRVFPVLWKIAKIFVDPKTRAKCVVLKNSELHKLCDYFDPEDLPEEFGGTCRCENGCLPPVPKHMVSFDFSEELSLLKWCTWWMLWFKDFCMQSHKWWRSGCYIGASGGLHLDTANFLSWVELLDKTLPSHVLSVENSCS